MICFKTKRLEEGANLEKSTSVLPNRIPGLRQVYSHRS